MYVVITRHVLVRVRRIVRRIAEGEKCKQKSQLLSLLDSVLIDWQVLPPQMTEVSNMQSTDYTKHTFLCNDNVFVSRVYECFCNVECGL